MSPVFTFLQNICKVVVAVCENKMIYIPGLALYFYPLINVNIQRIWMTTFRGYACFVFGPVVTDLRAISKPNVSFHGMFKYYLAQDIQLEFVNSSDIMLIQKCVYLAFCWWNMCLSGLKHIDTKWSTYRRHLNFLNENLWISNIISLLCVFKI